MKNNYSRGKKLIFSFFYELFWWLNFKSKLVPGIMSDFVRTFIKMFLLVELTFLGEQNFNLGLYSINFWSQRSNSIIKRWFFEILYRNKSPNKVKTYIFQLSSVQKWLLTLKTPATRRKGLFEKCQLVLFISCPKSYFLA